MVSCVKDDIAVPLSDRQMASIKIETLIKITMYLFLL